MFVPVLREQVSALEQVHAAFDRWCQELAAGASGWFGSTAGVTEDGRLVALARFESRRHPGAPATGPSRSAMVG